MVKKEDKKEKFNPKITVQKLVLGFISRYFNFFVLVIALAILAAGYFCILKPKYKAIKQDIKKASAVKEGEKRSLSLDLSRLNAYIRDYNNISTPDKEKIYKILPRSIQPEELMAEIEQLINSRGLTLTSIQINDFKSKKYKTNKPVAPEEKTAVTAGKIKIEINVLGVDYNGLKNLLKALENNLRLMDITNLSFSPKGESAKMTIVVYYLK